MIHVHSIADQDIIKAVERGLNATHKFLPSWLFYNEAGDRIFQKIMRMPEYYPTRCEFQIIQRHKEDFLRYFQMDLQTFELIEFGAGDGLKTELLLKHLYVNGVRFTYRPVDISQTILDELTFRIHEALPALPVHPIHKNYSEAIRDMEGDTRKVVFFLGANIGNFSPSEALRFMANITGHLGDRDLALVGFDLKKDPRIITRAYDDPSGITKAFNLNLLTRLNNELGATFDLKQFDHCASYDPETGAARSFLVSLKDQDVFIEALHRSFHFAHWETINTEISQKYDLLMMGQLISEAGLEIVDLFFDSDHYFCDVLLKKA